MISESQAKLLPSEQLKRELRAILKAKPGLYELTRRQPDDPDPGRKVTLFAFDDGKRQAYPLIEIMGKWQGKVFVGRVPGDSKDNSLAFELDAIKQYRKCRGCGPETEDQAAYVARYENRCKGMKKGPGEK